MIRAGNRYNGTISTAALIESNVKGTPGLQVMVQCDDDEIEYTIWLTEKNRERALADFETLGITPDQARNPLYMEHQLPLDICGRQISFFTKEEEWNGRKTVKVASISKVRSSLEGTLARSVACFFSGEPPEVIAPATSAAEEDDIPF